MVFAKYLIMSNRTSLKQQLWYYHRLYNRTPLPLRHHITDEKICYIDFLSLQHQSRIKRKGNYFTTSVIGKIQRSGPQWWVRPWLQLYQTCAFREFGSCGKGNIFYICISLSIRLLDKTVVGGRVLTKATLTIHCPESVKQWKKSHYPKVHWMGD